MTEAQVDPIRAAADKLSAKALTLACEALYVGELKSDREAVLDAVREYERAKTPQPQPSADLMTKWERDAREWQMLHAPNSPDPEKRQEAYVSGRLAEWREQGATSGRTPR